MSFWDRYNPDLVRYYPIAEDQRYWWEMRAPAFRDEKLLVELNNALGTDWDLFDVIVNELVATFNGTTLPHPDSPAEVGEPGFRPLVEMGVTVPQMQEALNRLPLEIVYEMWTKMKEVAPNWGPKRRDGEKAQPDGGRAEGLPLGEPDGQPVA